MSIQYDKIMNLADGKILYDDLRQRIDECGNAVIDDTSGQGDTNKAWSADKLTTEFDNVVAVQDEQPTAAENKIWLPATQPQSVQVASYTELTNLQAEVNEKITAPSTGAAEGKVLGLDENLDPAWVDQDVGTIDYTELTNKPQINNVTLTGNKSLSDLGIASENEIVVSDTQPQSADNVLWIEEDGESTYTVPSTTEMNTALAAKANIANPSFTGTLTLDDAEVIETDFSLLTFDENAMVTALKAISNVGAVKIVVNNMPYAVDTIPAHSLAVYVVNGNADNIASAIFDHLPVGYDTYGSTSRSVIDGSGVSHTVYFSRPTLTPIVAYVTLNVPEGYSEPTKIAAMQTSIYNYVNALEIGETLSIDKIRGCVFQELGNDAENITIKDAAFSTSSMYRSDQTPAWNEKFLCMNSSDVVISTEEVSEKANAKSLAINYSDLVFPVAAGTMCSHEGGIYSAKTLISTSETWTAAHWDAVVLSDEIHSIPSGGSNGYVLRKASATDYDVEWASVAAPTDSQVDDAVSDWLTAHPEATTTVQDGSITYAKLNSDLQDSVDDVSTLKNAINDMLDVETVYSKNLNKTVYPDSYTISGVTFTHNSDGSITMACSGDHPSANIYWNPTEKEDMWLLPAGTYTLSGGRLNMALSVYGYVNKTDSSSTISKSSASTSTTFTTDQDLWIRIRIDITTSASPDGITLYPQLEAGTKATEYQSPDYVVVRSEVLNDIQTDVSVLKDEASIYNKLTFSIQNSLTVKNKYISPSDGSEVSSSNYNSSDFIPVSIGDVVKYGLHATGAIAVLAFYSSASTSSFVSAVGGSGESVLKESTFTAQSNGFIRICTNKNYTDSYTYFDNQIPDATRKLSQNLQTETQNLQGEIDEINDSIYQTVEPGAYVPGYLTDTGAIAEQSAYVELTSQKIYGFSSLNFVLSFAEEKAIWFAIVPYNSSNTALTRKTYSATAESLSKEYVFPDGTDYIRFSFRSYGAYTLSLSGLASTANTVAQIKKVNDSYLDLSTIARNVGQFKPCYDHLFVNTASNITVPHESLYHVRLSARLGFNMIEANVQSTSDGVYFVNHLDSDGNFGVYFRHADGETDISSIVASTVTWDWIAQNVRYNSTIEKYRTRPCTLEEFLCECRQQNIIPMLQVKNADVASIADGIMGKNNYIAYGSKNISPQALHYAWANESTKEAILAYCENRGKPFVYGMSNPHIFTDAQLQDIINTLHENGYLIGTSYRDSSWYKYSYMGFDFNGTQTLVNRIPNGNLHNINTMFGFDGFTFTNATATNGILTFSADGTLTPDIESTTYPVAMIDIQLDFTGEITLNAIGEQRNAVTYTSDGTIPVFVCTPIINGSVKPTIAVASGTEIRDIVFKASVV